MGGLATTFALLGQTDNESAVAVLIGGLESSLREVQDQALQTLLKRRCNKAALHLLRRWDHLHRRWKQQIAQRPGWLTSALHSGLTHGDAALFHSACEAAVFTRDYEVFSRLAAVATDPHHPQQARAAAAALELCEQLAEELASPRDYRVRRDPQLSRSHLLVILENALALFPHHERRELLEAFLLLADREHALLKRVLQSPADPLFPALSHVLMSSPRPEIERLLLSYLDDPHAPLAALQIVGRRSDLPFFRQLARKVGADPAPAVLANLRRIDTLSWLSDRLDLVDGLRESEQPGVVQLALASAMPRPQALAVIAHVARQGRCSGRRAAAQALASFSGPQADTLCLELLDDEDPHVRAAAAVQLRPRGIPGAIQRLLTLLDSPHAVERQAAQASLAEFRFEHFKECFDQMPPAARREAAALVRRVDPQSLGHLRAELDAPSRGRRKRALDMVVAFDAAAVLEDALLDVLRDPDPYLRVEAIRVLAGVATPAVRFALRDALLDSHPLVQRAAEAALHPPPAQTEAESAASDTRPAASSLHDTLPLAEITALAQAWPQTPQGSAMSRGASSGAVPLQTASLPPTPLPPAVPQEHGA
jgi:HEAT repeat protein